MATAGQGTGLEAWYKALEDRDSRIRSLREENSALRGRLDEYIKALEERDTIIRNLRSELQGLKGQQPSQLPKQEGTGGAMGRQATVPGAPPAAP